MSAEHLASDLRLHAICTYLRNKQIDDLKQLAMRQGNEIRKLRGERA